MVILPAAELRSLEETAHLLRSPRNAQRLLAALQRALEGPVGTRGLSRRRVLCPQTQRAAAFQDEFREDLRHWLEVDRPIALRVLDLVWAVLRNPFGGIGNPEPLRHLGANIWSRRIAQEHRLVYLVRNPQIDLVMALYHY
ncbi:MAG: Txe/YoeB family addiction module toxin [Candidatus Handelsmanbacteria bacterium]|nr:Txe/YoeB family addiction module toxin [Candidatus Handelsmanbacteria bacterium]